ncbi:MAG: hypothetical protein F6K16_40925 [Symploca sp. SIO2B6]|nr:hypothetical protein [Symploca sp. SIO2B6]
MFNQSNKNELTPGLNLQCILQGHDGLISQIAWSPDGNFLASASFDSTTHIPHPQLSHGLREFKASAKSRQLLSKNT